MSSKKSKIHRPRHKNREHEVKGNLSGPNNVVKYKHIIAVANKAMLSVCASLSSLNLPAFASDTLSSETCFSRASDITVGHRILNKFGEPSSRSLRDVAFKSYLDYEEQLKQVPLFDNLWTHPEGYALRKAKMNLSTWLKTFKLDYNNIDLKFSPGESFISAFGEVSVYAKLASLKHWTCTEDVVDDVCHLVYYNRGLKAAARKHIGRMVPLCDELGYDTFSRHLRCILTIVPGARGASVPKNQETDRFINVEPTFNMLLQRWLAGEFHRCLTLAGNHLGQSSVGRNKHSIVYHDAQELHAYMIRNLDYATIDFKNASDSVLMWVVETLFPSHVAYFLRTYRSATVTLDGIEHRPLKLSSMGNGFTFEAMTLLLLSIARVFDSTSRVYGDDVIIKANVANRFIDTVRTIGFQINHKKTFLTGLYRESCGAFQFNGMDIISHDFRWMNCFQDVIVTANKLLRIIKASQCSDDVIDLLKIAHADICAVVPVLCKGPEPVDFSLHMDNFVYDCKWREKQMKSDIATTTRYRIVDKHWGFLAANNIDVRDLCYVNVPIYVPRRQRRIGDVNCHKMFSSLHNLYTLRSSHPAVRGKGKWVNVPCVVSPNGGIWRLSRLKQFPNIGFLPQSVLIPLLTFKMKKQGLYASSLSPELLDVLTQCS